MKHHPIFSLSPPLKLMQDIRALSELANDIWQEHFPPIIGQGQVGYMLERFQSETAIQAQISAGAMYMFILAGKAPVGYLAVLPMDDNTLHLSKLYVEKAHRGLGAGGVAVGHIESLAASLNAPAIWLTVNRHNRSAISAYERMGFQVIREQVTDIGGGYVMDDYVMSLSVSGTQEKE